MIKRIIKTLSVFSVSLLMFIMILVPETRAESNTGEIGSGGGCGPGGCAGGATNTYQLVELGYRVSLMTFDGNVVPGTHSVNYWQFGGSKIGVYRITKKYYDIPSPKQRFSGVVQASSEYPLNPTYQKQDFLLNDNDPYTNHEFITNDVNKDSGNNYARNVMVLLRNDYFTGNGLSVATLGNDKVAKISQIAKDCGYDKSPNHNENFNYLISDSADIVIQIEPITAIRWDQQTSVYIGSSHELARMEVFGNYHYGAVTYANPIIYAGQNDRDIASNITVKAGINLSSSTPIVNKDTIKDGSHAIGASLFRLKDYTNPICPNNFEAKKNIIRNNRNERLRFIADNGLLNGYDSNGELGALSDEAISLYGFPNSAELACGNYSCNNNATQIKNKFYGTAFYESTMQKLKNAVAGKNYNLLNTEIWTALNLSGPSCGKTQVCIAKKNISCDTDNSKTLTIADSTDRNCWYENEIGYNSQSSHTIPIKAKDTGCVDGVEDSCNSYRDTGCKIVCRQTVTFDFPGNVVNKVKAGQVFKWGTDNNKATNLFGKMKVKMTCQVKSNGNDCRTHKRKHKTNNKCDHKSSWMDSKTGFTCYGTWSSKQVNDTCSEEYPDTLPNGMTHPNAGECKVWNKKTVYQCSEIHSFDWATWVPAHGYLNSTVKLPDLSNLDTKVNIDYNLRYSVNDDLKKTFISGESQNNGATVTCYKGAKNNCKLGGLDISTHTRNVVGTYELKYTKKFNWYSSKLDGTLYDKSDYDSKTSSDSSKKSFYYYIGYSMPTSFKTHSGTYNDKLVATVSNVGFNDHFDSLLDGTGSFVYSCGLKIHNEIYDNECYDENGNLLPNAPAYCLPSNDPKGIDVVFREVQLINGSTDKHIRYAFPGAKANAFSSGKPRQKGANWAVLTNQEIYNVLNANVYNNKPMYEIKLDTRVITNIRDINKKAKNKNKDPYSGMHDMSGNNKTLAGGFIGYKCSDGVNGKYCASSFLSELYNKYGLTGECIWTSNTSDRANRIANGTYKKCKNV